MTTSTEVETIVVVGGTGAQGAVVVRELAKDFKYKVVVLTRDATSRHAQRLLKYPTVSFFQGSYTDETVIRKLFRGAGGVYVNLNGFNLGEKAEIYWGFRIYELAIEEGIQHYVWGSLDYGLKKGGYDPKYHCSHYDAKGRIAEFILGNRRSHRMKTSVLTSAPYFEMLYEGLFVPKVVNNGSEQVYIWAQPIEDSCVHMIALDDLGCYARWLFDNPDRSDGMDLEVASQAVYWDDLVETFMKVNPDKKAIRGSPSSVREYLENTGIGEYAPVTMAPNADGYYDPSTQSWWTNFTAFWALWRDNVITRDYDMLDTILPSRTKTLEEWMIKNKYDGGHRPLFTDYRGRTPSPTY